MLTDIELSIFTVLWRSGLAVICKKRIQELRSRKHGVFREKKCNTSRSFEAYQDELMRQTEKWPLIWPTNSKQAQSNCPDQCQNCLRELIS